MSFPSIASMAFLGSNISGGSSRAKTPECCADVSIKDFQSQHFSTREYVDEVFSSFFIDSAAQFGEALRRSRDMLVKKLRLIIFENYCVFVTSCNEVKRLEADMTKINSMLSQYKVALESMSNLSIDISKMRSLQSVPEPTMPDHCDDEASAVFDQLMEDLSVQMLERRFVLAADTMEQIDSHLSLSPLDRQTFKCEVDSCKHRLADEFLQRLSNSAISRKERQRLYSRLVRLGQERIALGSFLTYHTRAQSERCRRVEAQAGAADLSMYIREIAEKTVSGLLDAASQLRSVFTTSKGQTCRPLLSRFIAWASEDVHRLAMLIQKRVLEDSATSLAILSECLHNLFASFRHLDSEGMSLSFLLEADLSSPLLRRLESFFEDYCRDLDALVKDDDLKCVENVGHPCTSDVTSSMIALYDRMRHQLIPDSIVLIPSSTELYPYLSSHLSPAVVKGLYGVVSHYVDSLTTRTRDSHSEMSDVQHNAVLANIRALLEDLLPRLQNSLQKEIPNCSASLLQNLRSQIQQKYRAHAHFIAQHSPSIWLSSCMPIWPPTSELSESSESTIPSSGALSLLTRMTSACEHLKMTLGTEFGSVIVSMCCIEVTRLMGSSRLWKHIPGRSLSVSIIDRVHQDVQVLADSIETMVQPASIERTRALLQRVLDQAVLRCVDTDVERNLEHISTSTLGTFKSSTPDEDQGVLLLSSSSKTDYRSVAA